MQSNYLKVENMQENKSVCHMKNRHHFDLCLRFYRGFNVAIPTSETQSI